MNRSIPACIAAVLLSSAALAQKESKPLAPAATPAGPMMDFSKMGPGARKPTNEAKTRSEIKAFFAEEEKLMKKGDFDAMLSRLDFPIYMATDDLKGVPEAEEYSRERYVKTMKPFWENMPKDMQTTHKPAITVMSDSMAAVIDDFTIKMGKQKIAGKNVSLLVKRDGEWKWKMMAEPGWGGMEAGTGGSATPQTKKP
jgi:hypothetical protein